jgi:hypothetical protein
MRGFRSLVLVFLAIAAGATPAWAFRVPDSNTPPPTQHQMDVRYADSQPQPYAMTYTDEAARKLGIQDGQWEAFGARSSDSWSLKGGMDGGGPMIRLQWRPGQ